MRFDGAILRMAAWLVPAEQRAEWLTEWNAELWYARERGGRQAEAFARGSFRDAWWLRRNTPPAADTRLRLESPVQCLGVLALMAAACVLVALCLPEVRRMIVPPPYKAAEKLVMISDDALPGRQAAATVEDYRRLAHTRPRQIAEVAFYRVIRARAGGAGLSIALASGNLFELLGMPVPRAARGPSLVLTVAARRSYFGRDAGIPRRAVEVAGRLATVTAVVPADSWWLPGEVDGWLLDDQALTSLPGASPGFMPGRLERAHGYRNSRLQLESDGGSAWLDCRPLLDEPPVPAFLGMVLIGLVLIPATTSLNLGEYPAKPGCRRWLFLACKFVLVTPIAFFATLDLGPVIGHNLQPHGLLIGYVLAYRWVLIDQRQRCPECLRLLSHAMHVGRPSQVFLEWYGTEFVCMQGHGLLHVPESPTISFATQRWVNLDPSWSVLFPRAEAHAGKTGIA